METCLDTAAPLNANTTDVRTQLISYTPTFPQLREVELRYPSSPYTQVCSQAAGASVAALAVNGLRLKES